MVGSTVGTVVGGRYRTVRYGTLAGGPRVVSAAAAADESYWCGELSNASTVPYRTVAVSRYCRTCYCTLLVLFCRIHSVIRIS